MGKVKITIEGYEVTEKVVKSAGNSGRVYLPKSWIGKKVKIVLLDPLDTDRDKGTSEG